MNLIWLVTFPFLAVRDEPLIDEAVQKVIRISSGSSKGCEDIRGHVVAQLHMLTLANAIIKSRTPLGASLLALGIDG